MLQLTDVYEIKKRMSPKDCNITRMRGCYVDSEKNIVTSINERFLSLPTEEFYKYLDIACAAYSKNIDNKMLSLEMTESEANSGTMKLMLQKAVQTGLKDEEAVEEIYQRIIDTYEYVGNYLILLFYEAYDVPRIGTDGEEQGESEEVFQYVLCVICPVNLTAAGLEYNQKRNVFEPRERDWVVGKPDVAFQYPSWEERTAEYDKYTFYCATPGDMPHRFMELGLGTVSIKSATEIRNEFEKLFYNATQSEELKEDYVIRMNRLINIMEIGHTRTTGEPELILTGDDLQNLLKSAGIPEVYAFKIEKEYRTLFSTGEYPKAKWLLNSKALKKSYENEKKREVSDLMIQAAAVIEKAEGEETELTAKMRHVAERNR